jgi:Leucine-rich repeat (LRR) protein
LLIYQNGLRREAFLALLPSLGPSAESGSLEYLDINDNQVSNNQKVIEAFEDLLAKATNLRTLSISDNGISKPSLQFRLVDALRKSPSAACFEELYWNFDVQYAKVATRILGQLLENHTNLKKVKMIGTIHAKETRNELRRDFDAKGAQVMLSEWEQQAEDMAAEGKQLEEDDIYSDDCSEEEWDSQAEEEADESD